LLRLRYRSSTALSLRFHRLGLIAKLDLIEGEDGAVYKRGRRPHVPADAWEPKLVLLCARGLIPEDNGYRYVEGAVYFRESRSPCLNLAGTKPLTEFPRRIRRGLIEATHAEPEAISMNRRAARAPGRRPVLETYCFTVAQRRTIGPNPKIEEIGRQGGENGGQELANRR